MNVVLLIKFIYLSKKHKKVDFEKLKNPKAFIEYSSNLIFQCQKMVDETVHIFYNDNSK